LQRTGVIGKGLPKRAGRLLQLIFSGGCSMTALLFTAHVALEMSDGIKAA
jgi:hypothetical protein